MTILVCFHFNQFRNFKHYYLFYVREHLKDLFPRQLSYNCFVELESRVCLEMMLFLQLFCFGRCTGISFVDSTCVPDRPRRGRTWLTPGRGEAETWGIRNHTQPTSPKGANTVNPTWQRGAQVDIQVRPLRGRIHAVGYCSPLRGRFPGIIGQQNNHGKAAALVAARKRTIKDQ